jgi:hypothetical protein
MLLGSSLPKTWSALLHTVRPCFTGPSFATFTVLVSGLAAATGPATVTGAWIAAGAAGVWHHSRGYWLLGRARWSVDQVGDILTRLVVHLLLDPDAPVLIAVDDTLFRRSGRHIHATFWHHNGAATGQRRDRVAWGNNWVIAAIVVPLPFRTRPMALPVGFALWSPQPTTTKQRQTAKQTGKPARNPAAAEPTPTKQVLCCRLVARIAAALPDRAIHVVADAAYAGADGAPGAAVGANRDRGLPTGVTLTARLRANAKLHDHAQPNPDRPRRGGRPRTIGALLGTPKDLAGTGRRQPLTVTRYGRTDTVHVIDRPCLWYGTYRSRPIRVILVRDHNSTARAGYDLALITTDLTATPTTLIHRYADRWPIETMIEDAKQHTGVGNARTRTPLAVHRTVPLGLITHTLTVIWYTRHAHDPADLTHRRATAAWYRTKTEPAYHDMIIKLRRTLITARFRAGRPRNPTPEETLEVQLAWADAAA